jgi:UDP-N-acetylglucosamine 2-epimerase (non-hydrolysing)
VTLDVGTNSLVGDDPKALAPHVERILRGDYKKGAVPELWDGEAGVRIARILASRVP